MHVTLYYWVIYLILVVFVCATVKQHYDHFNTSFATRFDQSTVDITSLQEYGECTLTNVPRTPNIVMDMPHRPGYLYMYLRISVGSTVLQSRPSIWNTVQREIFTWTIGAKFRRIACYCFRSGFNFRGLLHMETIPTSIDQQFRNTRQMG
jgi:hypothetical protein